MRILFFVSDYWELHWLHNVIEAMDGEVFSISSECIEYCNKFNFKVASNTDHYEAIVVSNLHYGQQNQIAKQYRATGKKVIVIQHGWDPAISLKDNFWNEDVGMFSYYLVGCKQDYEWLTAKFGTERIIMTGIPRLDDILKIKSENIDLAPIYEEVGSNYFLIANTPTDNISMDIYRYYCNPLLGISPYKIVYKTHPGFVMVKSFPDITVPNDKYAMVDDNHFDRNYIYRLIKASQGVVIVESFLALEASFLGKPVIFWGYDLIPTDYYDKSENINQKYRLPVEMGSSIENPQFRPKQAEITNLYLFDGKNTERCVDFLKSLV